MKGITAQEARLLARLRSAENILKDILNHDGGAYDLEPRQSAAIMAFLGGSNSPAFTPAQVERAQGKVWMK